MSDTQKSLYTEIWEHPEYRKFSPGLRAWEMLPLESMLRGQGCRTLLDAGCGSGKLMRRIMEQHHCFRVQGFDIAENCLDPWFDGKDVLTTGCLWSPGDLPQGSDAVICTDVLEHIPTEHIPQSLSLLHAAAKHCVFLGIALFPDCMGHRLVGEPLHLTVKPPEWWAEQIKQAGLREVFTTVTRSPEGAAGWYYSFCLTQKEPA